MLPKLSESREKAAGSFEDVRGCCNAQSPVRFNPFLPQQISFSNQAFRNVLCCLLTIGVFSISRPILFELMDNPPSYSTATRMDSIQKTSMRKKKNRTIYTHPILYLFILTNTCLVVFYSGPKEHEVDSADSTNGTTSCTPSFPKIPREFHLFFSWVLFTIGQFCSLLYLAFMMSIQNSPSAINCMNQKDPTIYHASKRRSCAYMALRGYCFTMTFSLIIVILLMFDFGTCSPISKHLQVTETIRSAVLLVLFAGSLIQMIIEISKDDFGGALGGSDNKEEHTRKPCQFAKTLDI